jgi:hypothetical protein
MVNQARVSRRKREAQRSAVLGKRLLRRSMRQRNRSRAAMKHCQGGCECCKLHRISTNHHIWSGVLCPSANRFTNDPCLSIKQGATEVKDCVALRVRCKRRNTSKSVRAATSQHLMDETQPRLAELCRPPPQTPCCPGLVRYMGEVTTTEAG